MEGMRESELGAYKGAEKGVVGKGGREEKWTSERRPEGS